MACFLAHHVVLKGSYLSARRYLVTKSHCCDNKVKTEGTAVNVLFIKSRSFIETAERIGFFAWEFFSTYPILYYKEIGVPAKKYFPLELFSVL